MYRSWYFSVAGFAMYAEWNGVTRGHHWLDYLRDDDGSLLLWMGKLHVILSPPVDIELLKQRLSGTKAGDMVS